MVHTFYWFAVMSVHQKSVTRDESLVLIAVGHHVGWCGGRMRGTMFGCDMLRCLWSLWFEHLSCPFCSWHEMLALDSAMVASKQRLPMHQTWMRILNLNGGHEPGWTGAIIVVSCVSSQDFGSWKPLQNSQEGLEGQIRKAFFHAFPLPGCWGWRARRLRLGHLRIVKTRWFVVISCHLKRWIVFQGTLVFWSKWASKHSPCNLVFYATFVLAWLIFLPSWIESKWNI